MIDGGHCTLKRRVDERARGAAEQSARNYLDAVEPQLLNLQ